jgi:hypothetical protein
MKKIRFTDLSREQQALLQKVLDRNKPKTKSRKVKIDFTKHTLEKDYLKYLKY